MHDQPAHQQESDNAENPRRAGVAFFVTLSIGPLAALGFGAKV